MENKRVFSSLISFVFTILIFSTIIFAWYTLSKQASVDDFVLNTTELKSDVKLEVKKNDQEFIELITKSDFEQIFGNAVPSDNFLFRLTITNKSTRNSKIKVILNNIESTNEEEGFDMRNVFYLTDGLIYLNGMAQDPLPVLNEELELVHEQELNTYNFNNILVNKNINLIENYDMDIGEELELEFDICYDETTSLIGYQSGKLLINSISIFNN